MGALTDNNNNNNNNKRFSGAIQACLNSLVDQRFLVKHPSSRVLYAHNLTTLPVHCAISS
jgi:hypothetical protein